MASSQLISLPNALSVSSLLTIVRGAFQRESCCASALSGESIKAKRLHFIYNRGSRFHQIVGPYASLFLAKGQDRCDKLRQKPTFYRVKYLIRGEISPLIKVYVFNTICFSYFAGYSASNYPPFVLIPCRNHRFFP